MRLYNSTQVSQKLCLLNRKEGTTHWTVPQHQVTENKQQEGGDLIVDRKLPNPILAPHRHRALHQELLFCYRRGLLPRRRTELQCVLDKQREQHRLRELDLHLPSDLEVKLHTRRQRIQAYELEEKESESLKTLPEFVRVRETLRRSATFS